MHNKHAHVFSILDFQYVVFSGRSRIFERVFTLLSLEVKDQKRSSTFIKLFSRQHCFLTQCIISNKTNAILVSQCDCSIRETRSYCSIKTSRIESNFTRGFRRNLKTPLNLPPVFCQLPYSMDITRPLLLAKGHVDDRLRMNV